MLDQLVTFSEAAATATTAPDELLMRALKLIAEANSMLAQQRDKINALETIASHDMMTGLYNRRGLEQQIAREFNRLERKQSRGFSLVLFDLDGFKDVNDTHGHPAGDAAIRAVGDYFTQTSRDTDIAARLGGDEFALVLTDIIPPDAEKRVISIMAAMQDLAFDWNDAAIKIHTSCGLSHYRDSLDFEAIYAAADKALYKHKARPRAAA